MHLTAAKQQTIKLTSCLIQKDTTNPPGDESAAAAVLAEFFRQHDISCRLIEPSSGRVNVLAKVGPEDRPSICLLSHLDVVKPGEAAWQHDPFGGQIVDGEIWGRGAVDTKQVTAIHAVTMALLKPVADKLHHQVIFLATADEENGSKWGMEFLINSKPQLFASCEYALTEGGGFTATLGGQRIYLLDSGQKGTAHIKLSCTQKHSSHPGLTRQDTPLKTMLEAVNRIYEYQSPIPHKLGRTGAHFLRGSADILDLEAELINGGNYQDHCRCIHQTISSCNHATLRSLLEGAVRNSYSPNVLRAGSTVRRPPTEACASVKAQLLPGVKKEEATEEIAAELESLSVEIKTEDFASGYDVGTDNQLFEACSRAMRRVDPEAAVVPFYAIGRTDGRFLAPLGIKSFGFAPLKGLDVDEAAARAHGADERLSVKSLEFGLEANLEIVRELTLKG